MSAAPRRRKADPTPDVVVVGDHPAAYFAAALMAEKKAKTLHLTLPPADAPADPDRLTLVNPALFKLHKRLESLRDSLDLSPAYGTAFLSDAPPTAGRHDADEPLAYVTRLAPLRQAMRAIADDAGVDRRTPKSFSIRSVDETGLHAVADGAALDAKLMLLAGPLAPADAAVAGVPAGWADVQLHRYSWVDVPAARLTDRAADGRPVVAMSLDLAGTLCWGWLLVADSPAGRTAQAGVERPLAAPDGGTPTAKLPPVADLLGRWLDLLVAHGYLADRSGLNPSAASSVDLPFAGALERDHVADRTLLLGPAGGFYSATGDDVYPNCWSAVHAADVAAAALKAEHVQDALGAFRGKWGATLGDYLRGPQQNLRFLLPLIYANPQMTARYAEAVLLGKSVVR